MKKTIIFPFLFLVGCYFSSNQKQTAVKHATEYSERFSIENPHIICTDKYFHGPNAIECTIHSDQTEAMGETNITLVCSVDKFNHFNGCKQIRGH